MEGKVKHQAINTGRRTALCSACDDVVHLIDVVEDHDTTIASPAAAILDERALVVKDGCAPFGITVNRELHPAVFRLAQ